MRPLKNAKPPERIAAAPREHSRFKVGKGDFTQIRQSAPSPIDRLLPLLDGVRDRGNGVFSASCPTPVHQRGDRSRGLRVTVRDDDALLLWCGAGCGAGEIVNAVGLTLADLFPATTREPDYSGSRPKRPRLRAGDLLELVVMEALVCAVAARDLMAGKTLTTEDTARLDLAVETIQRAYREVQCH